MLLVFLRCTEVVQASTYFPCTTASDCPGTCYFKAERPICGIEVIDGYLARICVCVANECSSDQDCRNHKSCETGYSAICSTTSHQCLCLHTCAGDSDCNRYTCSQGGNMQCSPVYGATKTCACEAACASNADCNAHPCLTGSTAVCVGSRCECQSICQTDSDCFSKVTCDAGTIPRCSATNNNTCQCEAQCVSDSACSHHICGSLFHPKCVQSMCTCEHNPVNGGWSRWGAWNGCSSSCGTGVHIRHRSCNNPVPSNGGADCVGNAAESGQCKTSDCPVDGGWSVWSAWNFCSASCGSGFQIRQRTCTKPKPAHGGSRCPGMTHMTQPCIIQNCTVNGGWSEWSSWGQCSATCGQGVHIRSRTCTQPKPTGGGQTCVGNDHVSQSCSQTACPTDGDWSQWTGWNSCSVTCGAGQESRTRSCTHPAPSAGGKSCSGDPKETQACILHPCSRSCADVSDQCALLKDVFCAPGNVDGQNVCPQTCGVCPVDGAWGAWMGWSVCTVSCGGGTRVRFRNCDNPAPAHSGLTCSGSAQEAADCNAQQCRVDGSWTPWGAWTTCSITCDQGMHVRFRSCSNPSPASGGSDCIGQSHSVESCTLTSCPVNGGWSSWTDWSACSATCSVGIETRSRNCSNPMPLYGGKPCDGNITETRACNQSLCPYVCRDVSPDCGSFKNMFCSPDHPTGQQLCPVTCGTCKVDGNWTQWSVWSACSASCGNGTRNRSRQCADPAPAHGGRDCDGARTETQDCALISCPVDGAWSDWTGWSPCSLTCGAGVQTRVRHCDNPAPSHAGLFCPGDPFQVQPCTQQGCPVNGSWSGWSDWSLCSVTCDSGVITRTRSCTHPSPVFGGQNCSGEDTDTQPCNRTTCPSACQDHDSSCSILAKYLCLPENPQGQLMCPMTCGTCKVDGGWGSWGTWGACSATCGDLSVRKRVRNCDNPVPQYGGKNCQGHPYDLGMCNVTACPQGKPCPTCDENLTCSWDKFCSDMETCMVRSYKGYNFTVHCSKKEDCSFESSVLSAEIFCCDDRACLQQILGT
uniref:A disintegrin and metalloproteinase with thrombospondin motifs adt-1-like n=1 Tax=Crassostrea virginica TaxID=6565 RepID=A0A8B8ASN1_CRAVI|nr:A disintegrin and metalloproteinase with thrombospondin motifs adt-1-like [Crassostrea virginica]